jgi:hypothetical protein
MTARNPPPTRQLPVGTQEASMNYRFLVMNSSGKTARAEEWSCASDAEAIERASRNVPSFGAELWRGDHRLSAFAGPLAAARSDQRPSPQA